MSVSREFWSLLNIYLVEHVGNINVGYINAEHTALADFHNQLLILFERSDVLVKSDNQ